MDENIISLLEEAEELLSYFATHMYWKNGKEFVKVCDACGAFDEEDHSPDCMYGNWLKKINKLST